MEQVRKALVWVALLTAIAIPIMAAVSSPLLQWRDPVYIVAGIAGVMGLVLMLCQPLLAAGVLPGLGAMRGRRVHRWVGAGLVLAVVVHVAGLWITSPPDVVDALLFVSATPFSAWGVVAMWAAFGAAVLAVLRRRWRLGLRIWRLGHTALVVVAVSGTVVHAMLIEGTMGTVSKAVLCGLVVLATAKVVFDLRAWAIRTRRGT